MSLKKDILIDPCYNMDEPWRHSAKWNKPVTKGQILHDFAYIGAKAVKFIETESRVVVSKGWEQQGIVMV